jgi:hypothetical protein
MEQGRATFWLADHITGVFKLYALNTVIDVMQ